MPDSETGRADFVKMGYHEPLQLWDMVAFIPQILFLVLEGRLGCRPDPLPSPSTSQKPPVPFPTLYRSLVVPGYQSRSCEVSEQLLRGTWNRPQMLHGSAHPRITMPPVDHRGSPPRWTRARFHRSSPGGAEPYGALRSWAAGMVPQSERLPLSAADRVVDP